MAEMLDLLPAQRKSTSVEEIDAQLNEGDKEKQMERCYGVGPNLRCDLIETEDPREHDDEEGSDSNRRVYPENYAQGQAPCQTAGRHPAAELTKQRTQDPASTELADELGHKHIRLGRPITAIWLLKELYSI